ncbi:MAG: aminoacetone oxidase family FAD-binding enzyme, partial [Chloroflexi bacterium]|nr:aminoacetone oxidase family FAD-binding enzyme [Chloroflexota bacterium]
MAAITAAEANPRANVLILEKSHQLLAKVRISGGGRCNVTHACFDPATLIQNYPRGAKELRGAFTRFQPRDTVEWFKRRGVKLKTESDGRVFPVTDDSATIVECLVESAKRARVKVQTLRVLETLRVLGGSSGFELRLKDGEELHADRVLLATGSNKQGYEFAKQLGHTIEEPVPSLFTFQIKDQRIKDLSGISVPEAELTIGKLSQRGALLITHWGLSGPAVLKLSAWAARELHECNYKMELRVNWLADLKQDEIRDRLLEIKNLSPRQIIASHAQLSLPSRLWERLVVAAGVADSLRLAELSKKDLTALVAQLHRGSFQIIGKGVFKEEFVTCGGVR